MNKKIRKVLIIVLCVIIAAGAAASAVYFGLRGKNRISDSEAVEIMQELIPKASEINEIIWGKGIAPAPGENAALETVSEAQYRRADPSFGYANTAQLKEAIAGVYSKRFIESCVNYTAFEGANGALDTTDGIFARYIDNDDGELCVDITNKGFDLSTQIDPSSAKVRGAEFDKIYLTLDATVSGENKTLEITLILQDGSWRLDTPTY